MTKSPDLHSAYALETPDDSRALYRAWAATYDGDFIDASGYVLHAQVAHAFQAAGGVGPILDVGAGTGSVGQVLTALGYSDIDGTDISPEMLHVARAKGVYANLFESDILKGLDRPDGAYAGLTSAGTFTLGHVGPSALDEVVRLLKPNGLAVMSVRDQHFEAEGFSGKIAQLEPLLTSARLLKCPVYENNPDAEHAQDTAYLVHLIKA
ncbi:MAG: class I SAM-dependent methyltransferase [Pseudomonadota bacterium]